MRGDPDRAERRPPGGVEAHAFRSGRRNEDGPPPEGTEREQPAADADDDVEGHAARKGSKPPHGQAGHTSPTARRWSAG